MVDPPRSLFEPGLAVCLLILIAVEAGVSLGAYWRRGVDLSAVHGSVLLGPRIRSWYFENLLPFEEACVRWGIRPLHLSFAQLAGSVLVAICYATGLFFVAGWVLLAVGTLDIIDGRVARRTGSSSMRGAFLDSVIDRYADSLAFVGLIAFFRSSWVLWVLLFGLVGTIMVSYARARAEGLGADCRIGLLQRPERYVILGFGTILGSLWDHITGPWLGHHYQLVILTVVAVSVLVNVTAIQRVTYVARRLGDHDNA